MSPFAQAREVYQREPSPRSFDADLGFHLQFGFVFSTPNYFIMGRPVMKAAPAHEIVNPGFLFPRAQCDCWHVYLMAGDLTKAWDVLPWPLPWFSWERKNELRFYMGKQVHKFTSERSA